MTDIKSTIEEFRSDASTIVNDNDDDLTASNQFSTFICPLNEMRSTGSWALLERVSHTYSSNKDNVMLGSTCKPMVSPSVYYFTRFFYLVFIEIKYSSRECRAIAFAQGRHAATQ